MFSNSGCDSDWKVLIAYLEAFIFDYGIICLLLRYPFRYGLGMDPIPTASNFGLDDSEKLLPQYLQEIGYSSHIVGKWHLGYCREAYHPLSRGFDSFYGCLNGQVNYTDHLTTKALDFFDNREPVLAAQGQFGISKQFATHRMSKQQESITLRSRRTFNHCWESSNSL